MNTTVVGTSQAAAHVAGLGAYLLSTSKDLTPATVGEAITILAVPDRLLDLPVGSRTCWRSTTRRPADHLPTEGTPIVGSADYAAAFALVAQQRLQTPTTTDDLATDLASQDLAERIAHFMRRRTPGHGQPTPGRRPLQRPDRPAGLGTATDPRHRRPGKGPPDHGRRSPRVHPRVRHALGTGSVPA